MKLSSSAGSTLVHVHGSISCGVVVCELSGDQTSNLGSIQSSTSSTKFSLKGLRPKRTVPSVSGFPLIWNGSPPYRIQKGEGGKREKRKEEEKKSSSKK